MKTACEKHAEAMLRDCGLMPTPARVTCLTVALKAGGPVTRASFLKAFAEPPDRVTFYRTLKMLEARGLLRRSESSARTVWCVEDRTGGSTHMHFSCESCGRTECVRMTRAGVARAVGGVFGATGVRKIEAVGLCGRCAKARR